MEIILLPEADNDLSFWTKIGNKIVLKKITQLIENIKEQPFEGLGKPEPLKRRINKEHRLVYEIIDNQIITHSLRGHYK